MSDGDRKPGRRRGRRRGRGKGPARQQGEGQDRRRGQAAPAKGRNRRKPGRRDKQEVSPREFWGVDARPGEDETPDRREEPPARIRISDDPAAVVRSLGPPPLADRETHAELYFEAFYGKAVVLARALAAAGGILDEEDLEVDILDVDLVADAET